MEVISKKETTENELQNHKDLKWLGKEKIAEAIKKLKLKGFITSWIRGETEKFKLSWKGANELDIGYESFGNKIQDSGSVGLAIDVDGIEHSTEMDPSCVIESPIIRDGPVFGEKILCDFCGLPLSKSGLYILRDMAWMSNPNKPKLDESTKKMFDEAVFKLMGPIGFIYSGCQAEIYLEHPISEKTDLTEYSEGLDLFFVIKVDGMRFHPFCFDVYDKIKRHQNRTKKSTEGESDEK